MHNQLIPLEDITLATLDVCSNLVENYPPSHLHHLVAILHFKEDLQFLHDAGWVASRSRTAPFDVAVPDLCTVLPHLPRWGGVGHVPGGDVEVRGRGRGRGPNQPQVSACLGRL